MKYSGKVNKCNNCRKPYETFLPFVTTYPNYGERYRNGEAIATGFVESAVNQIIAKRFVKNQQMRSHKTPTV